MSTGSSSPGSSDAAPSGSTSPGPGGPVRTRIDWAAPAFPPRPRRRRLVYVGVGLAVAAVVAAAVVASGDLSGRAPCNPTIPKIWTSGQYAVIKPCGSRFTVGHGSYVGYSAGRFSDAEIVLGKFTSSVPLGAYLLNGTQYTALEGNSSPLVPPSGWFWSGGVAATDNVNATVPPSPPEYFLVLYDFGTQNASVVWSLSLIVAYVPGA